jgi:hypothetical protein
MQKRAFIPKNTYVKGKRKKLGYIYINIYIYIYIQPETGKQVAVTEPPKDHLKQSRSILDGVAWGSSEAFPRTTSRLLTVAWALVLVGEGILREFVHSACFCLLFCLACLPLPFEVSK